MDLTKIVLPDAVVVSGKSYKIKTGHPYWFRFADILDQDIKYLKDFDYIYIDEIPDDRQSGIDALALFFSEPKEIPRSEGSSEAVLDYKIDADYIYASIFQCYGVDLYEKELHWHKVRALLSGIIDTKLNEIIGNRSYTGNNKEMLRLKRIWALPVKMSKEDQEAKERFDAQFN